MVDVFFCIFFKWVPAETSFQTNPYLRSFCRRRDVDVVVEVGVDAGHDHLLTLLT